MKITAIVTDQGVKREIDFQGATLPDGRSIQGILDENEGFKKQIGELNKKTTILSRLIPQKPIRDIIEIVLLIFAFIGIIDIFYRILSLFHL